MTFISYSCFKLKEIFSIKQDAAVVNFPTKFLTKQYCSYKGELRKDLLKRSLLSNLFTTKFVGQKTISVRYAFEFCFHRPPHPELKWIDKKFIRVSTQHFKTNDFQKALPCFYKKFFTSSRSGLKRLNSSGNWIDPFCNTQTCFMPAFVSQLCTGRITYFGFYYKNFPCIF